MPVAPDLAARFAQDLAAIWPEGQESASSESENKRLGLAVSGGPDSMALLLLAHAAMPGRIAAATIDHGLRPESAGEAAWVAQACAARGIAHHTLAVQVAPGNVQAAARDARYQALAGWLQAQGLHALASAHHADDQAETVLMRLNRASGVGGLAAIRERTFLPVIGGAGSGYPLLRPLLGWRRRELAQVCAQGGVAPLHDPSNTQDRFDRVRLRKALADAPWLDSAAIAASARHLADADAALDWAMQREWAAQVEQADGLIRYTPQAPRAIALRVLARIVVSLGGKPVRGGAIAEWHDRLAAGETATLAGLVAVPKNGCWTFRREAPRRS